MIMIAKTTSNGLNQIKGRTRICKVVLENMTILVKTLTKFPMTWT